MDTRPRSKSALLAQPSQSHHPYPAPPSAIPLSGRPFPPQKPYSRDVFAEEKEHLELSRRRQEEDRQLMNRKVALQAERMYGQTMQLTQDQYDAAVKAVQVEEMADKRIRPDREDNGRTDWLRPSPTKASLSSLPPPPPPLPPHPPPTSSLSPPRPFSSHLDDLSRRPQQPSPSPSMFSASSGHASTLPPPPPPFTTRPSFGASSPPYTAQPHPRDSLPIASVSSTGRDGSASASKSSMSISSLLGAEPAKPREQPGPLLNGSSHSLPPSAHHSTASSPTGQYHGNGIPRHPSPRSFTNRFRTSSGGHTTLARSGHGLDHTSQGRYRSTPEHGSQISPRSDRHGVADWRAGAERRPEPGRFLQRPLSQPSGPDAPRREDQRRPAATNERQTVADILVKAKMLSQTSPQQPEFPRRLNEAKQSQPAASQNHKNEHADTSNYPFLSNRSVLSQSTPHKPAPNESTPSAETPQPGVPRGPYGPEALRRIRDDRLGAANSPHQRSAPPESHQNRETLDDKRKSDSPKFHTGPLAMERSESYDQALSRARDGENGHRNSLALALENNRRHGRLSPLPQAVQGAQGKSSGPSRDPSIKNEFAKMFAGIGSGVSSSGLAGSGTSTPFPPSPKQDEQRLPPGTKIDLDITRSRTASRMGNKRSRKAVDDGNGREGSARPDADRGPKRMRHHHHPPGHHHHHHRHLDDRNGTPVRIIGDPVATNNHHHHHPDGTIHYHTHAKATPAPQTKGSAPPRLPKVSYSNDRLLASVANLPRNHLGSILYSPKSFTTIDSNIVGANSKTSNNHLPQLNLTGKANSTFTVRIPRFYLRPSERQNVCEQRALWGLSIYTSDSDPLAAAIHAGWIRGHWGPDIPSSLIEPSPSAPTPNKKQPPTAVQGSEDAKVTKSTYDSPPDLPLDPPLGKDLHLTLLILPPLQKYESIVRHGINSREWGADHDGTSFMVLAARWVDAGVSSLERGLRAKRERVGRLIKLGRTGAGAGGAGGRAMTMGIALAGRGNLPPPTAVAAAGSTVAASA